MRNDATQSLFRNHEYDEAFGYTEDFLKREFQGSIVKVTVKTKTNPKALDKFVKAMNTVDLIDFRVVDETIKTQTQYTAQVDESKLSLDTMGVFGKVITEDPAYDVQQKSRMIGLVSGIYQRAKEVI
jgi:type II secretory pathway component PulJ